MTINKHTLWHNIRTISGGFFILGLIPLPFIFMGPVDLSSAGGYATYMLVTAIIVVIAQIMVIKYRPLRDIRDMTKKNQKWYGIIGISIILLFVLTMVLMPYITKLME